jgi:hypothetical protein
MQLVYVRGFHIEDKEGGTVRQADAKVSHLLESERIGWRIAQGSLFGDIMR